MNMQNNKQIETNMMFGLALLRSAPADHFCLDRQRRIRSKALQYVVDLLSQSPFFASQLQLNKVHLPREDRLDTDGHLYGFDELGAIEVYLGKDAYQLFLAARGESIYDLEIHEKLGADVSDHGLILARLERGLAAATSAAGNAS
jgi:hypothetical protein